MVLMIFVVFRRVQTTALVRLFCCHNWKFFNEFTAACEFCKNFVWKFDFKGFNFQLTSVLISLAFYAYSENGKLLVVSY